MASTRKARSLNDTHYRLLQDLATPKPKNPNLNKNQNALNNPPPPSFSLDDVDESEVSSSLRFQSDHDIPQFSAITDFDSPSPIEEEKTAKPEMEFKQRDFELVQNLEIQEAVGFEHEYSDVKKENNQCDGEFLPQVYKNEGNQPGSDFESRLSGAMEDNKLVKVKIAGRRRLCKLSSKDDENSSHAAIFYVPGPSDMTDFDPPVLVKNGGESGRNGCGGGNSIRDIFNDLSSKLELLSIEKKRVPRESVPNEDRSPSEDGKKIDEENNGDFPEYASAGSSFSVTPDKCDSSSDAAKYHEEGGQNLFNNSSASSGSLIETNAQKVSLSPCVSKKVESSRRSQEFNLEEVDVDCVALKKRSMDKHLGRTMTSSDKYVDYDIVDVSDDSEDESGETDDESDFILHGQNSNYKLPRKIAKILYPHQIDGLKWLWSLHCKGKGGILGDDMGLGKTMQICGFLAGLFHSNLIKRAMVVAPKTLLSHWIKELSAVGLSNKIREYFGTCPKARQYELQYILQDKGVLLTTYDIVRNNFKSLCGNFYYKDDSCDDPIIWDYMILDEGHLIKNPGTQRARSLLEIPSAHRIIISGTPIQNNLRELWALFNFCCPDLLGDKKDFKEKYEDLILRGNDKRASEREKRIGSTVAKDLRECIKPYFLRRLKSEVFQEDDGTVSKISKKNEIIMWLRLTSCQRRLYEAFLNSELVLSSFDHSPLAALTIMKKICDHPLLLTKRAAEDVLEGMETVVSPEDVGMAEKLAMYIADIGERDEFQESHDRLSCKSSFIISLLDNLIPEGHNVLIFSQTRKMLNLIQESLTSNGYEYLRIDGTTKASDRIKIVNEFQEGSGAPIFLLTSQVGGLGLTLTKADRVIVVDPAWNPSTDNQSVDRAYRIGQKKDVIVYRLMTCGTVEEKIYRKQIFKGGLFKTATEHKEQIRYFSQQDLKELFSLPKEGFDVSLTQQQLLEEHDHLPALDRSLKAHIEFLETLGIAGVSHHSLLYSKAAPVQIVDDEEVTRGKMTSSLRNSSFRTQVEHNVDGAAFAFKPKDVKPNKKNHTPDRSDKLSESEIRERIGRLSRMLADKVTISRLPDKGEKLQKQIVKLNLELESIRMARSEKEVIDLDGISGNFQKLNV